MSRRTARNVRWITWMNHGVIWLDDQWRACGIVNTHVVIEITQNVNKVWRINKYIALKPFIRSEAPLATTIVATLSRDASGNIAPALPAGHQPTAMIHIHQKPKTTTWHGVHILCIPMTFFAWCHIEHTRDYTEISRGQKYRGWWVVLLVNNFLNYYWSHLISRAH